MRKEKTIQSELSGYMSNLLRSRFGKGPASVHVTVTSSFITIHFRGFMTPMEKMLLNQGKHDRVFETRELLMNDVRAEIMDQLKQSGGFQTKEIYADWNLEKETGLIIAVLAKKENEALQIWPANTNKKLFTDKIIEASTEAEKAPGSVETYWLSDRSILVRRSEILVRIEKALIKKGFTEKLRLAKRLLEREVFSEVCLEEALNRNIAETFVDWNFEQDLGYTVFILETKKEY